MLIALFLTLIMNLPAINYKETKGMYHEDKIRQLSDALTLEKKTELDIWRVPEDLETLYQDITQALVEKGQHESLMADYRMLMKREQDMYDPFAAYIAGREHRRKKYWDAFMTYLRGIMDNPGNKKLLRERDKLFYRMCDILAGDERRLLLTDYNEIYRQYHGTISYHINRFFDMGYYESSNTGIGAAGI